MFTNSNSRLPGAGGREPGAGVTGDGVTGDGGHPGSQALGAGLPKKKSKTLLMI